MKNTNHLKEITTESAHQNNLDKDKRRLLSSNLILIFLTVIILFIESICILTSVIKKGIFKKEVLTKRSDIGFDIIIKT